MEEIRMKKMMKMKKRPAIIVSPDDSDEVAMTRFAREHPEYVQAEQEFWWKRDVEEEEEEDKANASTTIPVESDSLDWGDSKEEDGGCDDPDKDEFCEQLNSSDEE
ncbi:uncharacterized protein [Aegilops tauschii subsp. strangulata]|uniref:uncharacterized protein n=1 Tax=Aegilops tauschii subsp. strangulata TaxID=200361 RepID=UPI003CC8BE9E